MGDRVTFSARIAPRFEHSYEALQVGDRIVVGGCPLSSESTVEVGPQTHVVRIPCQLADVIDVIDDGRHGTLSDGSGKASGVIEIPCGVQHRLGEDHTDDTPSICDRLNHVIGEMTEYFQFGIQYFVKKG